jgi:hypothetical protein
MKLPHRRQFLHMAAGVVALPAVSRIAWAQAYPTRLVRLLIGFAPGCGTDVMARLIQPGLSERLGQEIIVENRPGKAPPIRRHSTNSEHIWSALHPFPAVATGE